MREKKHIEINTLIEREDTHNILPQANLHKQTQHRSLFERKHRLSTFFNCLTGSKNSFNEIKFGRVLPAIQKTSHVEQNVNEVENIRRNLLLLWIPIRTFGFPFFPSMPCEIPKKFISKPSFLLPDS
jgi:hypothetical protein